MNYKAIIWDFGGVITSSPFEAFNKFELSNNLPKDIIRTINSENPDDNAWAKFERNDIDLDEFDNLLITKTFSKIHGLASIRVGYGIADPFLIEALNRIRQPFNVNTIAQAMACVAINDHEHIRQSIELNTQQYEFLFNRLSKYRA